MCKYSKTRHIKKIKLEKINTNLHMTPRVDHVHRVRLRLGALLRHRLPLHDPVGGVFVVPVHEQVAWWLFNDCWKELNQRLKFVISEQIRIRESHHLQLGRKILNQMDLITSLRVGIIGPPEWASDPCSKLRVFTIQTLFFYFEL